jgi:hypothetical protein
MHRYLISLCLLVGSSAQFVQWTIVAPSAHAAIDQAENEALNAGYENAIVDRFQRLPDSQ